jgi:hypothetical protein
MTLFGPLSRKVPREIEIVEPNCEDSYLDGELFDRFDVFGPETRECPDYGYKRSLCNSYTCDRCRKRKLCQLRYRIAEMATARRLTRFVTLTLDPSKIPTGIGSHLYLRDCWRKMRVYIARRAGHSIEFIAVLEFHKSGIAHLHALIGVDLPQSWLSEAWQGVGGGRIVDIRAVDVHRIAPYLAKYLTKECLTSLPSGTRFFSCSRGIVLWPKKKSLGWQLMRCPIDFLYDCVREPVNARWNSSEGMNPPVLDWFEGPYMPPYNPEADESYDS